MHSKNGSRFKAAHPLVGLIVVGLAAFASGCGDKPGPNVNAPTSAVPQSNPTATESPGPSIGAAAPKFALKDQKGEERSLDALLKNGKVALVFFRSASW
jgi:hypothetical protein